MLRKVFLASAMCCAAPADAAGMIAGGVQAATSFRNRRGKTTPAAPAMTSDSVYGAFLAPLGTDIWAPEVRDATATVLGAEAAPVPSLSGYCGRTGRQVYPVGGRRYEIYVDADAPLSYRVYQLRDSSSTLGREVLDDKTKKQVRELVGQHLSQDCEVPADSFFFTERKSQTQLEREAHEASAAEMSSLEQRIAVVNEKALMIFKQLYPSAEERRRKMDSFPTEQAIEVFADGLFTKAVYADLKMQFDHKQSSTRAQLDSCLYTSCLTCSCVRRPMEESLEVQWEDVKEAEYTSFLARCERAGYKVSKLQNLYGKYLTKQLKQFGSRFMPGRAIRSSRLGWASGLETAGNLVGGMNEDGSLPRDETSRRGNLLKLVFGLSSMFLLLGLFVVFVLRNAKRKEEAMPLCDDDDLESSGSEC